MGLYFSRVTFIYRYSLFFLSRLGYATLRGFRRFRIAVACLLCVRLILRALKG